MPSLSASGSVSVRARIIVAATFLNLVVLYGVWYSYSVTLVALLRDFGWSRSLVAGVFSAFLIMQSVLAPSTGWLAQRLGPRRLIMAGGATMAVGLALAAETTAWWHLYLAFGGIAAAGMSFAGWVTSVVLIREWFPRRFGTVMGIASAGIGVGILVMVPATQALIEWYGWRGAYRALSLLVACWILPAALLLIRSPSLQEAEMSSAEDEKGSRRDAAPWSLAGALRSWRFWGVAGLYVTANSVTQMLLTHQVVYLVDAGVPTLTAATVAGTVGLVSIGGKMGWGLFSDRAGREWAMTLAFAFVAASIGTLVLAGRHSDTILPYVYATLLGVGYSVLAPVSSAIAVDLFAGPGFSTIYGALYVASGFGLAVGAWGAGVIFDWTGTYAAALWIGFVLALLTPTLSWLVAPRRPNPPPGIPRAPS